jgi:hypothetical protein
MGLYPRTPGGMSSGPPRHPRKRSRADAGGRKEATFYPPNGAYSLGLWSEDAPLLFYCEVNKNHHTYSSPPRSKYQQIFSGVIARHFYGPRKAYLDRKVTAKPSKNHCRQVFTAVIIFNTVNSENIRIDYVNPRFLNNNQLQVERFKFYLKEI